MHLSDIVKRVPVPSPWSEGDNIPWHDPDFSARMLAEHLTQEHDRASRRTAIIDAHVAWIHEIVLKKRPSAILDLGCGPGLYTNRLAALGHQCKGIDYSPASIAHARAGVPGQSDTAFCLEDIRVAEYGRDHDLVMLLYGEPNVFSRKDFSAILAKCCAALKPGAQLLLEPHRYSFFGAAEPHDTSWFSSQGGLFSPNPHLCLMENHWDTERAVVTRRYYVVDAATASVTRYAQSLQAYHDDDYRSLLARCGFGESRILAGLAHDRLQSPPELCAILATRTETTCV